MAPFLWFCRSLIFCFEALILVYGKFRTRGIWQPTRQAHSWCKLARFGWRRTRVSGTPERVQVNSPNWQAAIPDSGYLAGAESNRSRIAPWTSFHRRSRLDSRTLRPRHHAGKSVNRALRKFASFCRPPPNRNGGTFAALVQLRRNHPNGFSSALGP